MALRHVVVTLALCAFAATAPWAQELAPGANLSTASLSGLAQFDTDLDRGGDFHWAGVRAAGDILHQFTRQFAVGVSVSYQYDEWHFANPAAFGGTAPWKNVNQPHIGATFIYAPAEDWNIAVIPSVEWDYETGASTGDALEYGAVVSVAKVFSPTLMVGLGAGVFRQLYKTNVYPFPVVEWQIDDHWKLTNPFQAGPAGGAGLELVYGFNDRWDVGLGGSYRTFIFRLSPSGPVGNGIGQNNFVPVFGRVSYHLSKQTQIDLYGAALTSGRLTVKNASGNDLTNDSYKTAPALGLTLQTRF